MPQAAKSASFDDFLKAPSRLAKRTTASAEAHAEEEAPTAQPKSGHSRGVKQARGASRKEKVGLTIDPDIIDAIDDYIYHARKQGRRLKKNDVYETALRQFLGLEGEDEQ